MSPAHLQQLLQAGLAHHQAGRLADAERHYAQARRAAPRLFDPLHLSGVLALQQNRLADALKLLASAHALDPRHALCVMRLGLAQLASQQLPAAEKSLRLAERLDSKLPETHFHLAELHRLSGRPADALAALATALKLRPDYAEAHDRLGAYLADTRGPANAIPHFEQATRLAPENPQYWCNLGLALCADSRYAEALVALDRALKLDPRFAQALVGRALVFQQTYRLAEAAATYRAALALDPAHHEARSALLLTLHYLPGLTGEELFAEHQTFGKNLPPPAPSLPASAPSPVAHRPSPGAARLRLAFLSPDLRRHSVAYFLKPLLTHLPRERFEIFLYHDHPVDDAMSAQLRALAAQWRHVAGLPPAALEKLIRADAPDVLVDLAGHTGINRLPLFARRLAPVQINYLGYPDTTGVPAMDFRLTDAIADPADSDAFCTEKLIRFAPTAWSYEPPADAPPAAPSPCAQGAPLTFGSFNNFAKLSDPTLRLWARLLDAHPGSRLLLKGHGLDTPALREQVLARLPALGLDPARLTLLGRTATIAEHLALYAQIDLALDPFPYHGTTTTCEALWQGVPVISLRGDRHASRVGASLLAAAGHPEWIAENENDYLRIAASLAGEGAKLAEIRAQLRGDMQRSALLDHSAQAARFAEAVLQCAGKI